MNKPFAIFIILILSFHGFAQATTKIYFIHGYAGSGFEMNKILSAVQKSGFDCELFTYRSMTDDVDSVGIDLVKRIQSENCDTVSFVTHSMGALVVRSLYEHIGSMGRFPFIHRIVMIAPPNNGSPVADYFSRYKFLKFIVGPNVNNLTTNPLTGAGKYPTPTCEVGLVAGSYGGKKGFNAFINDDNDGVLIPSQTKMGIEKDVVFIRSWHVGLLFDKKVAKHVVSFLCTGFFSSN
ncbi:MAG TPA: hypothetical protein VK152_12500 [Paludibacter sp.]|nr:hypothetical protein [Paludibacter sp.]